MAFTNSGYIIVDQDPNLEPAIQGTQIPLLALLDDGVNPITMWSFDSNAIAGSKWTDMGTNHPPVSGGLVLPTFNSVTHPLGTEFIVFYENGYIASSHVSNGLGWTTIHKIEKKIEIPSYAFAEKLSPSIAELRSWVDLNLSNEDTNSSLLYLDLSKTYTQGSVETLTSSSSSNPTSIITKLTTTVGGVSSVKNLSIPIIEASVNVYTPSDLIDELSLELTALGSRIGDIIITDNSYDGTDWTFEYSNIGTQESIFISITIDSTVILDGGLSTATISGGDAQEPDFTWDLTTDLITRIGGSSFPKAVVLTGAERTATNLANSDSDKGKIIFNEDTSNLEYWNGTAWVVLSIV